LSIFTGRTLDRSARVSLSHAYITIGTATYIHVCTNQTLSRPPHHTT
jgi:hypothetical protein